MTSFSEIKYYNVYFVLEKIYIFETLNSRQKVDVIFQLQPILFQILQEKLLATLLYRKFNSFFFHSVGLYRFQWDTHSFS